MSSGSLRVLVVDDHELVRHGLRTALEAESDLLFAGAAGSVEEAHGMLQDLDIDVALLDVRLPDGDGIQLCREIRSVYPNVRCLMLSSFSEDEAVYRSILAGADGYILKGLKVDALMDAVRRVGSGKSLLDPVVTAGVLERIRTAGQERDGFTPQETRVLDGIAGGLTNREIAERLGLAEQTVKNHVSSLLAKLGVRTRTQAAVYGARRQDRH